MANLQPIGVTLITVGLSLCLTTPTRAEAIAVYEDPSTLTSNPCEAHLPQGLPRIPNTHILVVRNLYCLSNDANTKFADWVAYTVRAELMDGPKRDRNFRGDPDLPRDDSDYRGAYAALDTNKGHLALLGSFDGAFLDGTDLNQADLGYATLDRALLLETNLTGANLEGATFTGAVLLGTVLTETTIDLAQLEDAQLCGVVGGNSELEADRDCDTMAQIMVEQMGWTLERAQERIDSIRQKE